MKRAGRPVMSADEKKKNAKTRDAKRHCAAAAASQGRGAAADAQQFGLPGYVPQHTASPAARGRGSRGGARGGARCGGARGGARGCARSEVKSLPAAARHAHPNRLLFMI